MEMTFTRSPNAREHAGLAPRLANPGAGSCVPPRRFCARFWLILLAAFQLFSFSAFSANVRLYFRSTTNETVLLTNDVISTPISGNILANGGVTAQGIPTRIRFKPDGLATNYYASGYYALTNSLLGSSGVVLRIDDDGAQLYDITNVLWSGYNKFIGIVGSNLPPTYNSITNALGFLPVTQTQLNNTNTSIRTAIIATNTSIISQLNSASNVLQLQIGAATNTGITAATATNISAYQALIATNKLNTDLGARLIATNTALRDFSTNAAAYQSFLATNSFRATATNIARAISSTNNTSGNAGGATNLYMNGMVGGLTLRQADGDGSVGFQSEASSTNLVILWADNAGISTPQIQTDLNQATNLGYAGLSIAARTSITNASLGAALNATNKLDTDLRTLVTATTNGINTRLLNTNTALRTLIVDSTNKLDTDLRTLVTATTNGLSDRLFATNTALRALVVAATNNFNGQNIADGTVRTNEIDTTFYNFITGQAGVATNVINNLSGNGTNTTIYRLNVVSNLNMGTAYITNVTRIGAALNEDIIISAGRTASSAGAGDLILNGGDGASQSNGGGIGLVAGSGTGGGDFAAYGGSSTTNKGGEVTLIAGSATASQGGGVTISAGDSSSGGKGGDVTITSGDSQGGGNSGSITIAAGAAGGSAGFGSVYLKPSLGDTAAGTNFIGLTPATNWFFGNNFFNRNIVLVTNASLFMNSQPLFRYATNNIGVTNAGSAVANGTFLFAGGAYFTNRNGNVITNNGSTWQIKSGTTVLYSSATLENSAWTIQSGSSPAAKSFYGNQFILDGQSMIGVINSTNLDARLAQVTTDPATVISVINSNYIPGYITRQNVNEGFSQRFFKSIYDGRTANLLNFGDDQINITGALWRNLEVSFTNRTTGPSYGSSAFNYRTAAGITTLYRPADSSAAGIMPFFTYGMGNGSSFTNRQISDAGFPTENIIVNYYPSNSFGTFTIYTNVPGASANAFRTVDANNSSAWGAFGYTNWTIPYVSNLVVSVVSSGTNMIIGIGQTLTNSNQAWAWDDYEDAGVRLSDFTSSSIVSNLTGRFFASNRIDVMLIHDLYTSGATTSNDWRTIQSNFQNCLSNYNVLTDLIYFTPAPIYTTSLSTDTLAQRDAILATSRDYNARAFDAYSTMLPVLRSLTNQLYWTSDNLHLSNSANAYVLAQFAQDFGFSPDKLSGAKLVYTDKALRAGGNNFSGTQNFKDGSVTITNGNYQLQRAGGNYTRISTGSQYDIASFLDSGSGNAVIFGITNTFGTVTIGGVGTTTLGGPNWTTVGAFIGNGPSLTNLPSASITQTNFVLNTIYTNDCGRSASIRGVATITPASVVGVAALDVMVSQNGGSTFTRLGGPRVTTLIGTLVMPLDQEFAAYLASTARYYLTNNSTGAGNSAAIVSGTGQFIPMSKP